jgi:hypothetical protein
MDNINFSISNYKGYEDKVLHIRNQNRPEMVSRTYLDWRYLNDSSLPPVIFWVQQFDGTIVGMASLIFRRFWMNNEVHDFAVLGDISLNSELRGKGISKELFKVINSYIESHNCYAFVMPNFIASKSLSSTGWVTKERFVSYVYIIDPIKKLLQYLPDRKEVVLIGKLYRYLINYKISFKKTLNYSMQYSNGFDESFDALWIDLPKQGVMRDRCASSLRWRYGNYPNKKYSVIKFLKGDLFIGYIIYKIDNNNICIVYDILAKKEEDICPILSLFLKHQLKNKMISMVRIPMNENNYYSNSLKRSGFMRRDENNIIQVYAASSYYLRQLNTYRWFNTAGDKDV